MTRPIGFTFWTVYLPTPLTTECGNVVWNEYRVQRHIETNGGTFEVLEPLRRVVRPLALEQTIALLEVFYGMDWSWRFSVYG